MTKTTTRDIRKRSNLIAVRVELCGQLKASYRAIQRGEATHFASSRQRSV